MSTAYSDRIKSLILMGFIFSWQVVACGEDENNPISFNGFADRDKAFTLEFDHGLMFRVAAVVDSRSFDIIVFPKSFPNRNYAEPLTPPFHASAVHIFALH